MGIGMALHEETLVDHRFGRVMNANIAEYHVPVNADVQDIKVIFVDEPDSLVNPLGIKGVGEIGIVGVAAAIANAVYHATGKRVRDLPITLDKLQSLIGRKSAGAWAVHEPRRRRAVLRSPDQRMKSVVWTEWAETPTSRIDCPL